MTLAEFLNKIPKDGWKICRGGMLRRGSGSIFDRQCPITAVYGKNKFGNGVPVKAFRFGAAAKEMGLDIDLAVSIVNAADHCHEGLSERSKLLRRMLLERTGLKEKKPKKKRSL
jgi:hypothetical protein